MKPGVMDLVPPPQNLHGVRFDDRPARVAVQVIADGIERVVLIFGDHNWQAPDPIYALCKTLPGNGRSIVITGGASGADTIGAAAAVELGHRSIVVSPWKVDRKHAGIIRNAWMMELMDDLLTKYAPLASGEIHAFLKNIAESKRSVDMVRRARAAAAAGMPILFKLHSDTEEHIVPESQLDAFKHYKRPPRWKP